MSRTAISCWIPRSTSTVGTLLALVGGLGCFGDDEATVCVELPPVNRVAEVALGIDPQDRYVVVARTGGSSVPAGLYRVELDNPDSTRFLVPLTPVFSGPFRVCISPDGLRMAYFRANLGDIMIYDMQTQAERRVTFTRGNAFDPEWTNDNKIILYNRGFLEAGAPDSTAGFRLLNVDTGAEIVVRSEGKPVYGRSPSWVGSRRQFAFTYGSPGAIYVYDFDQQQARQLTDNEGGGDNCLRAIESRNSVFYRAAGQFSPAEDRTFTVNLGTGHNHQVSIHLTPNRLPSAISASGEFFIFTGPVADSLGVTYVRRLDDCEASNVHRLTHRLTGQ